MEKVTNNSPLQWPMGWARTQEPVPSRFGRDRKPTIHEATNYLFSEIELLGGNDIIISSDLKYRKDGYPYSNQKEPEDKGAAVYFNLNGMQKVIACDSFNKIGCNLWSIAKTINALRGIERWGCSDVLNRAFSGFEALPEKSSSKEKTWYEILQMPETDNAMEVKRQYRKLALKYHPDGHYPNEEKFKRIKNAYNYFTNNMAIND